MGEKFYYIKEFAGKASISVRTLRYYDKLGLLEPAEYSDSGYRRYSDRDLERLRTILALKFIGFPLKEIKHLLDSDARELQEKLSYQKMVMQGKQTQIEKIILAIEQTEKSLVTGLVDFHDIVKGVENIQMKLTPDWVNDYLTIEERKTMRELTKRSYSDEALKKIVGEGWTEEKHKQHVQQYKKFRCELTRLVQNDANPKGGTETIRGLRGHSGK